MISIRNNHISLDSMGLFTTDHEWERENVVKDLCELIYVLEGEVSIKENDETILGKGNMLIISPSDSVRKYSCNPKSVFYWIKFHADNLPSLVNETYYYNDVKYNHLFKEMLHHKYTNKDDNVLSELILAQILELNRVAMIETKTGKLVADVYEMIRLNASAKLKVCDIAELYGYNMNHLSRIIKKEYGKGIKALIDDFIIMRAKSYLVNSNHSIKEINVLLKFDNENSFVKFYKYHENETPTQFRNEFSTTRSKIPQVIE